MFFTEGSFLESVFGKMTDVNSFHHQAVRTPGENVMITARSSDGVLEGIEVVGGHSFIVVVQWHPEMMFGSEIQKNLFRSFVEAVGEH